MEQTPEVKAMDQYSISFKNLIEIIALLRIRRYKLYSTRKINPCKKRRIQKASVIINMYIL